jgi:cytochrome c-type biogenesis protein CcmH/NrfG
MKRFVAAVACLAIVAGPAYAQLGKGQGGADPRAVKAAKDEKERAAIEKEYDETMSRLRSQAPPPKADPWSKMRPADNAKH